MHNQLIHMSDHHMNEHDSFRGMRLLTEFKAAHSAFGEFVILKSSFVDTLTGVVDSKVEMYPDQQVMIRLSEAKALIIELKKRVQYIEAGIEDAGSTFID